MGWRGRRPDRPGVIRRTGRWSAGLRAGPGPARGRPDPARPTRRGGGGRVLGGGAPSVAPVWPGVLPAAVAGSPAIAFRTVATLAALFAAAACGCPAGVLACGAGGWPPGAGWPAAGCPAVAPAGGRPMHRGPQWRAPLNGRGCVGVLRQQRENRAGGAAQRGGRGSGGVVAGDQAARGQGQRGGGLGVDDGGAFTARAAGLDALAGIARRAIGLAGFLQAAGLADRIRARAGNLIGGGGGHRRAEHGVQPLHQDVAQRGGTYAHVSGAW